MTDIVTTAAVPLAMHIRLVTDAEPDTELVTYGLPGRIALLIDYGTNDIGEAEMSITGGGLPTDSVEGPRSVADLLEFVAAGIRGGIQDSAEAGA